MIRISDVKRVSESGGVAKVDVAPPKTVASSKGSAVNDGTAIATLLHALLVDAIKEHATAIHIEPHGTEVIVRLRVDGLLRPAEAAPKISLTLLAKRVKALANLDTHEDRVPQDGRFDTALDGRRFVVRVSLLPVADGEKIVLHLSDQSHEPHDLEKLGYWGNSLVALREAVTDRGHGLVVVGGPSGAGKTSTLYGLLHLVADPSLNIATVEDTIEHRLPGINQTPVNTKAGMTFASAMRAVMHQDPNVLVVSDIQEPEATGIALQSALAGRLVLVGMSTHNIADTFSHLVGMGIEPYLLASASRAIANQRLVRRLCLDCRESYKPGTDEIIAACTACGMSADGAVAHIASLETQAAAELGAADVGSSVKAGKITRLWRAKEGGCAHCGGTGYRGRLVVAEVLTMSPALQKLVFTNAGGVALYDQAISEGMVPMPLDGLVKAALGLTSIEEILRVVTA